MKKQIENQNKKKALLIIATIILTILLLLLTTGIINTYNKNKIALLGNEEISKPNEPMVSAGMIPIKREGENFVITTFNDTEWYNYEQNKPAYIMLNDGTYQSEIQKDMTGKKLASENVGDVIPNDPNIRRHNICMDTTICNK